MHLEDDPGSGASDLRAGLVEIEHDGEIYRIPAALKQLVDAGAEQARNEQALAERSRALEAAEGRIADYAQLQVLDHQLDVFAGLDWELTSREAPEKARKLWARFQKTQDVREQFAGSLAREIEGDRLRAERDDMARFAQTDAALSREIEGWSPETAERLVEYAAAFGVTRQELRRTADPRLWKILHRARSAELGGAGRRPDERAAMGSECGECEEHLSTREWIERATGMRAGDEIQPLKSSYFVLDVRARIDHSLDIGQGCVRSSSSLDP